MIGLLAPLGLAALTALALPVLLHLVRRPRAAPTPFAALRWLPAARAPARQWRLRRPWLLALRLLLLLVVALLLAKPVWRAEAGGATLPDTVVVPGVARGALTGTGPEARWLAPGFPGLASTPPAKVDTASLLRELDARLPRAVALTVIAPEVLSGLDGAGLALSRPVDWRIVPGIMPAAPAPPARRVLHLRHGNPGPGPWWGATVAAWNGTEPGCCQLESAPAGTALPAPPAWLVWAAGPPPAEVLAWVAAGGSLLAGEGGPAPPEAIPLWPTAEGAATAWRQVHGRGVQVRTPGPLAPAGLPWLLDGRFPGLLAAVFDLAPAPARAPAAAVTPGIAPDVPQLGASSPVRPRPLDPVLVGLIAVLALAERVLAGRRGRTRA